ncbi:hypothetical protein QL285_055894 [Trifolium repens]|nr:hypothetical protein QL285_055894 [Trifolium repens]
MGGTSSSISRTDVSMSATGEDQSVVYSTNDSRTCTFRAIVGVETASINLMDYTFDEQGTKVCYVKGCFSLFIDARLRALYRCIQDILGTQVFH